MVGGVTYCKEAKQEGSLHSLKAVWGQSVSQATVAVGENESPGHFAPSVHYTTQ